LEDWPGAVVVVSHDRAFLERTVTDVLAIDAERPGRRVPGGFAAWEAQHASGVTMPAQRPSKGTTQPPRKAPAGRSPSTLRRLLREIDKEIAAHERRRDQLTEELAAAGNDHVLLARLGHDLAATESALGASEQVWLELSTELEGG
jgi:ATP-binding cassette subfamily F protein uup